MKVRLFSLQKLPLYLIVFTVLYFSLVPVRDARAQEDSIAWYSMEEAQQLAKKNRKKVLIFAEATWCVYCKKMKKEVFPQHAVIDSMNTYFYPVMLDIESENEIIYNSKKITQQEFAQRTGMQATPTFFFLDEKGNRLGAQPGFIPAQTFRRLLGFLGSDAFEEMEFQTYLKKYTAN